MMMRESVKEYFILGFNFGPNNKCLRRDNFSKMVSGVTIGSLDL